LYIKGFTREYQLKNKNTRGSIRQVTKGEDTRTFFTLPEYEAWKEVRGAAPSDGGSGSDPEPLNSPNMFFFPPMIAVSRLKMLII